MYKKYWHFVLLITVIFVSCNKNDDNQKEKEVVINEVELNLDRGNKVVDSESPPQVVEPIVSETSEVTDAYTGFFFSGRTELLSIKSSEVIGAEDFVLGQLFEMHNSTVEEKNIVTICSDFFNSFENNEISMQSIHPSSKMEIMDYYTYFIKDKIDFSELTYGKPHISGNNALLKMRIKGDNIRAFIYLLKNDNNLWVIDSLELDLRGVDEKSKFEKWFPSIKINPLGLN